MNFKPDTHKIAELFKKMKDNSNEVFKILLPSIVIIMTVMPMLLLMIGNLIDDYRHIELSEIFSALPMCAVLGAVIAFAIKPFIKNLILKDNAKFISEIKSTGIIVEDNLITGKMLKIVQPQTNIKVQEVLPKKSFDVAIKINNISNIEINEKIIGKVNFGKICKITSGTENYYLMCMKDEDLINLKRIVLSNQN